MDDKRKRVDAAFKKILDDQIKLNHILVRKAIAVGVPLADLKHMCAVRSRLSALSKAKK